MDQLVEYERRLGLAWTKDDAPGRGLPVQPASLSKVQEVLKPDEVLLEYVLDDPISFCLVVSQKGAYVRVLPAGRKEIENLSQQFVGEIRTKGTGAELSKRLYAMLVKPLPEAATATRFIIAPDAILNLLPFEALHDTQGEYLLKSRVISYVPSGTILNMLRRSEKRQLAPRPLLAVGDVEYENQGGSGRRIPPPASVRGRIERGIADLSGIGLHDLPETRAEVEEIGKIVGSDAVILLGKDATETGFKKQPLDQFRILHLAVHGFADTQYPERSALVLGTDPQSGDDGLLQVREIIRLRLKAELTTLSACDSGVGKLQGQEGISNLVEAFLVAGSKSVVASLWSADDTFASALMEQFYRHLARGEDTSSALRNAKLDLLARYGDQASPFDWAAFIAVGETSTPIGIRPQ
jgi:CHAT domain-containing protein